MKISKRVQKTYGADRASFPLVPNARRIVAGSFLKMYEKLKTIKGEYSTWKTGDLI
jgi:hypothetical protein